MPDRIKFMSPKFEIMEVQKNVTFGWRRRVEATKLTSCAITKPKVLKVEVQKICVLTEWPKTKAKKNRTFDWHSRYKIGPSESNVNTKKIQSRVYCVFCKRRPCVTANRHLNFETRDLREKLPLAGMLSLYSPVISRLAAAFVSYWHSFIRMIRLSTQIVWSGD